MAGDTSDTYTPTAITNTPGRVPYIADDTRAWVDGYRVGNKVKAAFLFRSATDSNYINSAWSSSLPAYGNRAALTNAICNILSPGQRIPGCLQWSTSEDINNTVNQAQLTVLDALPVSTINATITGFGIGTMGSSNYYVSTADGSYEEATGNNYLTARWHSQIIRYHWVMNGNGLSARLPDPDDKSGVFDVPLGWLPPSGAPYDSGNHPISAWTDATTGKKFQEENLQYRMFEPDIIYIDDESMAQFPDPAVPPEDSEGDFTIEGQDVAEWWQVDHGYYKRGIGAYYIQAGTEVMRVTMIDRNNNALYVIPGGRGAAGYMCAHHVGDTVTLLGIGPFTGEFAGFGYMMPADFALEQSIMRPGNCFVSYEGYGNPGDYLDSNGNPVPLKQIGDAGGLEGFDRRHNIQFTGYWFVSSPEITLDDSGVPQLQVTFNSAGYVLTQQQITQDNILRMAGVIDNWARTTFDQSGESRAIPGTWQDFNNWDPTWPNSYPVSIEIAFAQDQDFLNHMQSTNFGTQCAQCVQEFEDYVNKYEGGVATGSIAETRSVGKHIYEESICVFNGGTTYDAGPLRTYGRLMTALGIACWENPLAANELGTRWTKIPQKLFNNMNNWTNGRCWNGQLAYEWTGSDGLTSQTLNYTNEPLTVETDTYGSRIPLTAPFSGTYDRQPWTAPMADLTNVNRMSYYITREGYPVFVPLGRKLRGCPGTLVPGTNTPQYEVAPGIGTAQQPMFAGLNSNTESADQDPGRGEWHLSYGGSIDEYDHTIDPSSVMTVCYVTAQTALAASDGGSAVQFTIAAGGTGMQISQSPQSTGTQQLVWYPGSLGNIQGLKLTGGAQVSSEVSLDQLQLGLDWNTKPSGMSLTLDLTNNLYKEVPAIPVVPNPGGMGAFYIDSNAAKTHPTIVTSIQNLINFMITRRYIGGAVVEYSIPDQDSGGALTATPAPYQTSLLQANGSWTGNDANGVATSQFLIKLQEWLASSASDAPGNPTHGWFAPVVEFIDTYGTTGHGAGATVALYNNYGMYDNGNWDMATYQAVLNWSKASAEYIETDIWWYAMSGLSWNDYVCAVLGIALPQYQSVSDGTTLYAIDQTALANRVATWAQQFDADVVNYGNMLVDTSIQQASQTVISTNFADPRILIGDVIWGNVPSYLSTQNAFGDQRRPFNNGIYVTDITRTLDLQQGTYQATYTGYAYRGLFDDAVMKNPSNYVSTANNSA